MIKIPAGLMPGMGQNTGPTQMLASAMTRIGTRIGRPARKRRPSPVTRVRAKSSPRRAAVTRRPARLVKGSAAAKRYMASIRKRRRR